MFVCFLMLVSCGLPYNVTCTQLSREYYCGDYLICSSQGKCSSCETDSQCPTKFYCKFSSKFNAKVCNYEPLSHDWDKMMIIGTIIILVSNLMVAGAGIGGGALYVPILIIFCSFPAHYAIPTSKALIFGGTLATTLFNLKKRHVKFDRPLINFNIAALMQPASWLGTILGVIINSMIPAWLQYTCQVALLSYTTWFTTKKGLTAHEKYKNEKLKANETKQNEEQDEADDTELKMEGEKQKAFDPMIIWILLIVWAVFLVLVYLKGGQTTGSVLGISFCSSSYWLFTFLPFPVLFLFCWWIYSIVKHYPIIGEKAEIHSKETTILMASGLLIGLMAGFLGIGGGIIIGPIMLMLNIEAEEMTATSSFMICLTASSTTVQYMLNGILSFSDFLTYSVSGFVTFLIGMFLIKWLLDILGDRSIILFILAGVIGVSSILMVIMGTQTIIEDIKNKLPMGFRAFCQ